MSNAIERIDEIDATTMHITLYGRDGQGVHLASQVLADAFVRSGCHLQALEIRRDGREGTARVALWVGNRRIRRRCEATPPHCAIVLDPTLLPSPATSLIRPDGVLVVNSPAAPCGFMPGANRMVTVDVTDIAERAGLGPIVSVAALGAFAGTTFLVGLDAILEAVTIGCPDTREAQTNACREAYAEVTGRTFISAPETSARER